MTWPITWWEYTGDYGPERDGRGVRSPIMRNMATGERAESLPFGACFDANRDPKTSERTDHYRTGADGLAVVCIVPRTTPPDVCQRGWWFIDGRANNCTKPDDGEHRCWVRHGTVGQPLTIDKAGLTCDAGAGSIQMANWHGFLQNGVLHA